MVTKNIAVDMVVNSLKKNKASYPVLVVPGHDAPFSIRFLTIPVAMGSSEIICQHTAH